MPTGGNRERLLALGPGLTESAPGPARLHTCSHQEARAGWALPRQHRPEGTGILKGRNPNVLERQGGVKEAELLRPPKKSSQCVSWWSQTETAGGDKCVCLNVCVWFGVCV